MKNSPDRYGLNEIRGQKFFIFSKIFDFGHCGGPLYSKFSKIEKFFLSDSLQNDVSRRILAQKDDSTRLKLPKLKA